MKYTPLNDLSADSFLHDYWQQKPLFVTQAFPNICCPVSPEELAGIACEEEASARLVIENIQTQSHPKTSWEVHYTPLSENNFTTLPQTHWTLLVNDIETWLGDELARIYQSFDFIPNWRMDDLMLSYASKYGSVGAHTDEYDVFLIQLSGTRQWNIAEPLNDTNNSLIPDIDLAILEQFETQHEWTLKAGDMLYLPPNWPHHGISQSDDCFTLSIGFRAPDQQSLLQSLVDCIETELPLKQRFTDQQRPLQQSSSEISYADRTALKALLLEEVQLLIEEKSDHWLGCYLSEPKDTMTQFKTYDPFDTNHNYPKSIALSTLYRPLDSRMYWLDNHHTNDTKQLLLFAEGDSFQLPYELKPLVLLLCDYYDYESRHCLDLWQQIIISTYADKAVILIHYLQEKQLLLVKN